MIDEALYELRMTFGGGIRIYCTIKDERIVLLLQGGNKSTQQRDIEKAKILLVNLED